MKWKHKYMVGITVMSMFFALPLVSADDEDVVVYGGEFEPEVKTTASTNETSPINEGNAKIESSAESPETQTSEFVNNDNDSNDDNDNEAPTEPPGNFPIGDVIPKRNPNPIDEIKNEIEVSHLSNENDNHQAAEIINYTENSISNDNVTASTYEPIINDNAADNFENTPVSYNDDFNSNEFYNDVSENSNSYESTFGKPESSNIYSSNNYNSNNSSNSSDSDSASYFRSLIKSDSVNNKEQNQNLKKQKARFVKLLSDDSYEYYLDRNAVRWVNMPYSTSEYMADVWIRMIEKSQSGYGDMPSDLYNYLQSEDDEITAAAEKGIAYDEVDIKVLRSKKYFLEHYYIRPKTKQIQFLCELEVIGRPQNTISERTYEYKNWENLIPGSVEYSIYKGVLSDIGTGKAGKRGHMTFVDMLDEYARIALN